MCARDAVSYIAGGYLTVQPPNRKDWVKSGLDPIPAVTSASCQRPLVALTVMRLPDVKSVTVPDGSDHVGMPTREHLKRSGDQEGGPVREQGSVDEFDAGAGRVCVVDENR